MTCTNSVSFINPRSVYKSAQGTYPQEIHHFYWDITTIWMADYNMMVSYDNQANILSEIRIDANTGDTTSRIVNTYDAAGRLTERLNQNWINGSWENYQRELYVYDEHDNLTITLFQTWQGGNWFSNSGSRNNYVYDASNHITEMIQQWWDSNTSSWININKYIYSYDVNGYLIERVYQGWDSCLLSWYSVTKQIFTVNASGMAEEVITMNWDNGISNWINYSKLINIIYHEWTGDFNTSDHESYTALLWNSGIWENWTRVSTTYDANGGWVRIAENYFNNNWVNSKKETQSYDEHGNYTGYQFDLWVNNTWSTDNGTKFLLTYDGNNLIQRIYQMWVFSQYDNQWKEEYSDFISIEGIDIGKANTANLRLFPNPTHGTFYLKLDDPDRDMTTLEIVAADGHVVCTRVISDPDIQLLELDLSECAKGIYFVRLYDTREVKVGKVILQ
ncbi:MAG: T9SS type A sorting domain-containing protein [Bacteroidales bacterium]|nr:T9SS type A sorting domain-containing protein [Bacteroidales bacterium]